MVKLIVSEDVWLQEDIVKNVELTMRRRFHWPFVFLRFEENDNHQMDVVTAFLNGKIDEEIYMKQPDGYTVPGKEDMVCKLKKSLYVLKQSPRCWNKAFHDYMEQIGFKQSAADPCVYISLQ